jgi:hypothetical protein
VFEEVFSILMGVLVKVDTFTQELDRRSGDKKWVACSVYPDLTGYREEYEIL